MWGCLAFMMARLGGLSATTLTEGFVNVPAQELPVWVEKVPAGEMGPAMYEDTEYAIVERKELNPSWLISGAWFEVLGYGKLLGEARWRLGRLRGSTTNGQSIGGEESIK